jgi:hypothetical protein
LQQPARGKELVMGVFFQTDLTQSSLRARFANALSKPSSNVNDQADKLVGLVRATDVRFKTGSFLIALAIFVGLLALAAFMDHYNWVKDASSYIDLASTALGAVLGFIGGEAAGTKLSI